LSPWPARLQDGLSSCTDRLDLQRELSIAHHAEPVLTDPGSRAQLTVVLIGGPTAVAATTKAHTGGALPEYAASALVLLQPHELTPRELGDRHRAARGLSSKGNRRSVVSVRVPRQ